jgi:type VI secretion system secreted protein VgrG
MVGNEALSDAADPSIGFAVAVSAPAGTDPSALVGSDARLVITSSALNGSFSGVVTRAGPVGSDGASTTYALWIEPALALTRHGAATRMFQAQTALAIAQTVLSENAVSPDLRIGGSLETRECTVQYEESDWDFISRLMEEEGIFHWFAETPGAPQLVLSDGANYDPGGSATYAGHLAPLASGQARIRSFGALQSHRTETATVRGYDFFDPTSAPESSASLPGPGATGERYRFDEKLGVTTALPAALELERATSRAEEWRGTSNLVTLRVGRAISVSDGVGAGFSGSYAVTSARHVLLRDDANACLAYANEFGHTTRI